jgi:flagellar protein FliO/FliZ
MKSLTYSRGVVLTGALTLWHSVPALAATGESTPLNLGGGSSSPHHVGGGSGSSIVRTIVGLFIVIAVIYGVAWILRRVKRSGSGRAKGTALNSVASMPLGSGRSIHIVRAGSDVLVVGVGEHGVTPIQRYTEAEAIEAGLELNDEDDDFIETPQEERPFGRAVEILRRMTVRS